MNFNKFLIISTLFFLSVFKPDDFLKSHLFAQQLQLPDELIIGSVTDKPDTLSISKDLSRYHSLKNHETLIYNPNISHNIKQDSLININYYGYLFLKSNSSSDIESRLLFQNPYVEEINLFTRYFLKKTNNDFMTQKFDLYWQPNKSYSMFKLSPILSYRHAQYKNKKRLDIDSDINELSLNILDIKVNSIPSDVLLLNNLNTSLLYFHSEEIGISKQKAHNVELDLYLNSTSLNISDNLEFSSAYYYDNIHIYSNLYWKSIPFFTETSDLFAFHFQYSKYLFPSLVIEKSFYLNNSSYLVFDNKPSINNTSKTDFYNMFPYAGKDYLKNAEQTPLNMSVYYNFTSPLSLQLGISGELIKNYNYIGMSNSNFYWLNGDLKRTKFFLNSSYSYNFVKFSCNTGLINTELKPNLNNLNKSKAPWIPHLKNESVISYDNNRFRTALSLTGLFNRYGLSEDKINNAFVLDNRNAFRVNKNLTLNLDIKNILNQKYFSAGQNQLLIDNLPSGKEIQPNLPRERITSEISFIWYF